MKEVFVLFYAFMQDGKLVEEPIQISYQQIKKVFSEIAEYDHHLETAKFNSEHSALYALLYLRKELSDLTKFASIKKLYEL